MAGAPVFLSPFAVPWECSRCHAKGYADPSLVRVDIENLPLGWIWVEVAAQHRGISPECACKPLVTRLTAVLTPCR